MAGKKGSKIVTSVNITNMELDLILLYYTFADQYGNVDIEAASAYAFNAFGYVLSKEPFKIGQLHMNILMDREAIPDTRLIFSKIKESLPPQKSLE